MQLVMVIGPLKRVLVEHGRVVEKLAFGLLRQSFRSHRRQVEYPPTRAPICRALLLQVLLLRVTRSAHALCVQEGQLLLRVLDFLTAHGDLFNVIYAFVDSISDF